MEEIEIWKDIPNYEGFYQVSNLGRIKSLERITYRAVNGNMRHKEKIKKQHINGEGYFRICLSKLSVRKTFLCNRLVLLAFKGEPPQKDFQSMHLDDNPSNNRLDNLQWGSPSTNQRQSWNKGRRKPIWDGIVPRSRPTSKKVAQLDKETLAVLNVYISINAAVRNVPHSSVYNIGLCCRGILKSSGGYSWSYA